ncbi:hypothetical protein THAPSDRAFT_262000, partial [Thalassiosira pseudonana CCMP1335]
SHWIVRRRRKSRRPPSFQIPLLIRAPFVHCSALVAFQIFHPNLQLLVQSLNHHCQYGINVVSSPTSNVQFPHDVQQQNMLDQYYNQPNPSVHFQHDSHNFLPLDSPQTHLIHIPPPLTNQRNLLQQTLGLRNLSKQTNKNSLLLLIHEVIRLSYQYRKCQPCDGEKVLNELGAVNGENSEGGRVVD